MILNYAEMENQYVSQYKQKGLDINILRPADFENYKQFIEESGNKVTVIGNTTLTVSYTHLDVYKRQYLNYVMFSLSQVHVKDSPTYLNYMVVP